MQIFADSPENYIAQLPQDRQEPMNALRKVILENIPDNFVETMGYGMIGYVVPLSLFPKGYLANPNQPLPFVHIASQKNFIALYHMGIYGSPALLNWFVTRYTIESKTKLDMGKGCIRFKKINEIPYPLIGELMTKITVSDWIDQFEKYRSKPK